MNEALNIGIICNSILAAILFVALVAFGWLLLKAKKHGYLNTHRRQR
jgi:hypothetical protein